MIRMTNYGSNIISANNQTLAFWSVKSLVYQGLLVAAAVGLPSAAHLMGLPVRFLLPMHWPILLAGLMYGWRGGLLVGMLAPSISFAISGFPLPHILPAMTVELAVYGLVAGFLKEKLHFNGFTSLAISIVAGRIAFVAMVLAGIGSAVNADMTYFKAALVPGVVAIIAQIALMPILATWLIKRSRQNPL
jgi:uncharacterized membrane protein